MFRPSWPSSSSTSKSPKIAKRHAMMIAWQYIKTYWCIKSIAWMHSKQESNDNIKRLYRLRRLYTNSAAQPEDEDWLSFIFCNCWAFFMLPNALPSNHSSIPPHRVSNTLATWWRPVTCLKDSHQNRTRSYGADTSMWQMAPMSLMSLWVLHGKS